MDVPEFGEPRILLCFFLQIFIYLLWVADEIVAYPIKWPSERVGEDFFFLIIGIRANG